MRLKEIKNIYHKELGELYPKEEVDSFFYMMTEHYLGLERFVLALEPDLIITKEEEQPLFEGLSQLKLGRPIQHILEKAYFFDLELKVNEHVLIPRPETEELVRWVISEAESGKSEIRILDIGTGSGCIAIALAKNLPHAKVYALDISEQALKIAKGNALTNKVDIKFVHTDIFKMECLDVNFDIIVSNPPYVRELEKKEIHKNVTGFEPGSALFVSNEAPLIFYERIIGWASKNLKAGGVLYFEINQYLGKETQRLLEDQNFLEIELRKDMFGNDRMLKGILSL